jgi:hypothetical protein
LDNGTNQLHDFNPGFGLPVNSQGDRTFWTTAAIPDADVNAHAGAGKADMSVANLHLEDYFNLANALADGHEVDASVSFNVEWTGDVTRRVHVENATQGFAGRYAETQARISWTGSEDGFTFVSDPASTSTSIFAETGHERNGVFFPGGDDNDGLVAANVLPSGARTGTERALSARGTANDDELATLLTGTGAAHVRTLPLPGAADVKGFTPASHEVQPLDLLDSVRQDSAKPLSVIGQLRTSSSAMLDEVFVDLAGKPLEHSIYQALANLPVR